MGSTGKDKRFGRLSYIYALRLFLARSEKRVSSGQGIFVLEIHSVMQPTRIQPDLKLQAEIKEVPVRQVAYIRLTGSYQSIDYMGAWLRLTQHLKEQDAQPADGCPICIYHDDPKVTSPDKLRTDICATCLQPVQPRGAMGVKQIGGNRQAVFLYQGPYQNLQAVYDTIYGKLLPEAGCTLRDEPGAERYLNNPQDTQPDELLTEIYIPVE